MKLCPRVWRCLRTICLRIFLSEFPSLSLFLSSFLVRSNKCTNEHSIQYVIQETMRIHSTSSLGLPRQIPFGTEKIEICGQIFHGGDIVSVPTYTIHHSTEIWGPDADAFVPERWTPGRLTTRQKAAFIPFSTGPRACVGRNVAEMELTCTVGTVFRNFDFIMEQKHEMQTREGFLRKPLGLAVGIRRRDA